MPVSVQFTVTGIPPIKFSKIIEDTIASVDKSLSKLADGAVDHMQGVIKAKTYRSGSTGNLSKAIQAYKIENGYGIGNIAEMNTTVPYWAVINYGGYIPLSTQGKVIYGNFDGSAPNPAMAGSNPGGGPDHFTKGGSPLYRMKPQFPIMPKNYIEDTISWVVSYMDGYNLASTNNILP